MPPSRDDEELVKTTVMLPAALWRAAKIAAVDDRMDLRDVVIAALEAHLKRRKEVRR
jgi:hypothetical protein